MTGEGARVEAPEPVGKAEGRGDACLELSPGPLRRRMLHKKPPERHHGGPAGHAVIRDVDHAARLELPADELDDDLAVLRRDPAVDAVQGDEVEIRKVAAGQEFGEAVVVEVDISQPGCLGKALGADDVAGVEVGGVKLDVRVGGCQQVGREALAASELAIVRRGGAQVWRLNALQERQETKEARGQLLVKAMSIFNIDNVTC